MTEQFIPPFDIAYDEVDSDDLRMKTLINFREKCRYVNGVYPDDFDPSKCASDDIKSEYLKWLISQN